jgi:hypothetical protein
MVPHPLAPSHLISNIDKGCQPMVHLQDNVECYTYLFCCSFNTLNPKITADLLQPVGF